LVIGTDAYCSFAGRVGFVLIAGILAAITTNVSYWNWYGFPGVYTASYMLIEIVGFVLVGVAAALVLRKHGRQSETHVRQYVISG
jgi:hypothetical protein